MSLYLGPLGAMTEIRCPLQDIPVEKPRSGGTHQALSGATTTDYIGSGGSYEFKWKWLDGFTVEYLEAIRSRHIRGPLRFVLPGYRHNRLSYSASTVGTGGVNMRHVTLTGGSATPSRLWPADAPPVGRGLDWHDSQAGMAVRLDMGRPAPILPGETVTGSIYVRSTHADQVAIALNRYGDTGTAPGYLGTPVVGSTVTLTANTWQRLSIPAVDDGDTWGVSPAVQIMGKADPGSVLTLAAAQVEPYDTVTNWRLGGASPVVTVDSKPATWPRAGKSHHTLKLVEA